MADLPNYNALFIPFKTICMCALTDLKETQKKCIALSNINFINQTINISKMFAH